MRVGFPMVVVLLLMLALTGMLILSGCGGAPADPAPDQASAEPAWPAEVRPESIVQEDDAGNPEVKPPLSSESADATGMGDDMDDRLSLDESEPVVTWTRASGTLKHNDELSIDASGRAKATARSAEQAERTIRGVLDGDQVAQVMAWVQDYVSFTRRDIDDTRAVSTTRLHGSGTLAPASEKQAEIAEAIADIFFDLIDTQ